VERLIEALALSPQDSAELLAGVSRRRGPAPLSVRAASKLPVPSTTLIGRKEEHDAALRLLRWEGVRLLTLVRAGGIGKTRLAIEVAADLFSYGVTPAAGWTCGNGPCTAPPSRISKSVEALP